MEAAGIEPANDSDRVSRPQRPVALRRVRGWDKRDAPDGG
jgi:hypothetical protein